MTIEDRLARIPMPAPFHSHDCSAAFRDALPRAQARLQALGLDEAALYRNTISRAEGDHYGMYTVEDTYAYALLKDGRIVHYQNDTLREVMPFEKFIRGIRYHEAYDGWKDCDRHVHERLERIAVARDGTELG